ncbi:sigma factor-like helix-turn-helix DNA-binding protein [Terrihalobacillus insolitus]
MHLYYFEDLSLKEIEAKTGVSLNTVKTRVKRARERLRELLLDV